MTEQQVIIGMDPHKSSNTIAVPTRDETMLARRRFVNSDDGFVEESLWTGVGRARSGAGAGIVGDPDQVIAKLRAYQDAGVQAFILSGYTHRAECDLVARYVLPHLEHAAIRPRFVPERT